MRERRGKRWRRSGALALALGALPATAGADDDGATERDARDLLERYCLECHAGEDPRAGLDLARAAEPGGAADWALVRDMLVFDEMPPKGHARPSEGERAALLAWIDARAGAPAEARPSPPLANPALRRLNRVEYRNSVRDLFGIEFPADEHFPPDEIGHGFDTVGDALAMPDLLFERYLLAAERIAERAIVLDEPEEPPRRRIEPEEMSGDGRPAGRDWWLYSAGEAGAKHRFPRAGEYLLRASAGAQQAGPDPARMALCVDGRELARFDVEAARGAPEEYAARVRVEAGRRRVEARFLNDYYRPEAEDPDQRDRNLAVAWIEVEGPLDPPPVTSFQRELFARFGPELGEGRTRAVLAQLARAAWRRPPEEAELDGLVELAARAHGFDRGLRLALEAILVSPSFLFRVELDPVGGDERRPLSPHELAARLSYFLWSTTPDAELSALADRGALAREDVLRTQVERMLGSPRSIALAEGFATQWLQIRALERASVDAERFPAFDDALRASMRQETVLFFDAVLRERRGAWELVDGEFAFVDERLARLYGIEGVEGPEMRRVSLAGLPRRGVVTQASVLAVTSAPTRTAPVKRGKWILEALLGEAPPPPPPGVGVLDESAEAAAEASLRERLERHRADPACAVCHQTLDPLGFGLENFDAIGAWRDADEGFPVDASGELPDGRSFSGPLELVELLRADDGFLRCLVEKLLVYALGRGLERGDRGTVDGILAGLDPEAPTLWGMIEGIALSEAFRERGPARER